MMNIQEKYPDLDIFKVKLDNNISDSIWNLRLDVEGGNVIKLKVDISNPLNKGSFGKIFNCNFESSLSLNHYNFIFKLIDNSKCNEIHSFNKEVCINYLLSNTTPIVPKSYPFVFMIEEKTKNYCYNGFLSQKIENDIKGFKRLICDKSVGFPEQIVNKYFGVIKEIKDIIEELYKIYKFKHNDLHASNVLFEDYSPKIIDFGESTINHIFPYKNKKDVKKVNIIPQIKDVEDLYKESGPGLITEIILLYKQYPLTDLHLYTLSSYRYISNFEIEEIMGGVVDISRNYIDRLDSIYHLSKLNYKNRHLYFDEEKIEINRNFEDIYDKIVSIIKHTPYTNNLKKYYDSLFGGKWNILNYRYISYFIEVYLSDKINYEMYNKELKSSVLKSNEVSQFIPELSKVTKLVSSRPELSKSKDKGRKEGEDIMTNKNLKWDFEELMEKNSEEERLKKRFELLNGNGLKEDSEDRKLEERLNELTKQLFNSRNIELMNSIEKIRAKISSIGSKNLDEDDTELLKLLGVIE